MSLPMSKQRRIDHVIAVVQFFVLSAWLLFVMAAGIPMAGPGWSWPPFVTGVLAAIAVMMIFLLSWTTWTGRAREASERQALRALAERERETRR